MEKPLKSDLIQPLGFFYELNYQIYTFSGLIFKKIQFLKLFCKREDRVISRLKFVNFGKKNVKIFIASHIRTEIFDGIIVSDFVQNNNPHFYHLVQKCSIFYIYCKTGKYLIIKILNYEGNRRFFQICYCQASNK